MNMYLQELKMAYKTALFWTLGMLAICFLFLSLYPSMASASIDMNEVFSKFPEAFLRALGISKLDMSTLLGFYGMIFSYATLIGSLFAMKLGIGVLSEEVRCKTSDFLVVKPVRRVQIVTAKMASVFTLVIAQDIIYVVSAFLIATAFSPNAFDQSTFITIHVSLFLVQLFFIGFGLLLSVVLKKIKSVLPITMGVVFGFFILQMLNQTLDEVSLTYITPFGYFDMADIIATGQLTGSYVIYDCILVLVFIGLTYLIYQRKDMPSV